MRKYVILATGLFVFLCGACKQYNLDVESYLSYWSSEAYITGAVVKAVVQNDTDGVPSVPSAQDVSVTFQLQNPKSFELNVPSKEKPQTHVIVFPYLKKQPVPDTDYTLTQSDDRQTVTLTYKAPFLQAYEWGAQDLSSTLTLYAKDGRKFRQTYTYSVKANTPPPVPEFTVAKTSGAPSYYVLCITVPNMDKSVSGGLLHKDIARIEVNGAGYALRLNEAQQRFIPETDVFIAASAVEKLTEPDAEAVPTGGWVLYYKTDVEVTDGAAKKDYTIRLIDAKGLVSGTLSASTKPNKAEVEHIHITKGTKITGKGTQSNPIIIGVDGTEAELKIDAPTAGTTVHCTVTEVGSSAAAKYDGNPIVVPLPLNGAAEKIYKIEYYTDGAGFAATPVSTIYYRVVLTHSVTFHANGGVYKDGSSVLIKTAEHNTAVSAPDPLPEQAGQKIEGWYTDTLYTAKWDFSTPVLSNTVLYARWKPNTQITVTFKVDGGAGGTLKGTYQTDQKAASGTTEAKFEDMPHDSSVSFAAEPSFGYAVDSWTLSAGAFTSGGGNGEVYAALSHIAGDVTVMVKFKLSPINIDGASADAWKQLKEAVRDAPAEGIITIHGTIKATNADGNSGAIEVTKKITIQGKSGDPNTDILDANSHHSGTSPSDAPTTPHRIFTVKSGGDLTLENLTLKRGLASGSGPARDGGAIYNEGTLTMYGGILGFNKAEHWGGGIYTLPGARVTLGTADGSRPCIIKNNTGTYEGGGIYNKGTLTMYGGSIEGNTTLNDGGGLYIYQGDCTLNTVDIHDNIVGTGKKGSGIYLYPTPGYTPSLTLTGTAKVGNSGNTNTLYLYLVGSNSAFVTAKNLAAGSHINIEPYDYLSQKDKTLVKLPDGASAAAYQGYFHLTGVPPAEIWELAPSSDDKALLLKQAKIITSSGTNPWGILKTAVEGAGDGDTIVINGTIQATSAAGNFGDITVSKSITIRGKNGNPATDILDANKDTGGKSAHRIFNVTGGNLTMEGLTLTGGMAIASGVGANIGGGIYVGVNSRAELKNCIITACKAARVGGGIYSKGELILDNCTIGGEQYYNGIDPAKPKGNTASSGGGVSSNQGNLTIIGGAITYNTADGPGGGIAFGSNDRTATLKVTETDISHNKAKETGGGIYLSAPGYSEKYVNATLQNVTVKNNELTSTAANDLTKGGGGIFFTNYTNGATLTIIGGSIEGNNARNFNGGGIYITTERDNYVNGTLTLKDGARISGNSAENGGGVAVNSAKLIIESGCTIGGEQDYDGMDTNKTKGNKTLSGGKGGGIYVGKKAECTIKEGVTIRHNTANASNSTLNGGGGIYVGDPASTAETDMGTLIVEGTADNPVNIQDCITNNPSGAGGGIYSKGKVTLTHARISGCKAPDLAGTGGGIFVRHGQCTLIHSEVRDCEALSGAGGGVYVYKDPVFSGRFTMQGSSRIVLSSDNEKGKNDIFLKKDNGETYITLSGKLTGTTPVGRITVPDTKYNALTKVLDGDITVDDNYKKFTVTPKGLQDWYIDLNGKLTTTRPSP